MLATVGRVRKITKRLEKQLGLDWLTITHLYDCDGEDQAHCVSNWEYRQATITWAVNLCASMDDDMIELTAIHEYVHLLVDPIASLIPEDRPPIHAKVEEFAVENIARVVRRALAH